jgi:Zn-finger nucleic acid-binding protein
MAEGERRRCPKCDPAVELAPRWVSPPGVLGEVELDVCPTCRGMWLDWSELEQLVEFAAEVPGAAANMSWQRDLQAGRCASCQTRPLLERVEVGSYSLDRCPRCLGIWFDGGELAPTLSQLRGGALPRELIPLLRLYYKRASGSAG